MKVPTIIEADLGLREYYYPEIISEVEQSAFIKRKLIEYCREWARDAHECVRTSVISELEYQMAGEPVPWWEDPETKEQGRLNRSKTILEAHLWELMARELEGQ